LHDEKKYCNISKLGKAEKQKGVQNMKVTKKEAINEIKNLIEQMPHIASAGLNSTEHIRWLFNCRSILERTFGQNSTYYRSFAVLKWRETGSYPIYIWETIDGAREERDHRAFLQCMEIAQGIFLAAIDEIENAKDISDLYKDKREDDGNLLIKLLNAVNNKFRIFFQEEPEDEKDVQNNFERLLVGCDFSYSREKEHIVYSTKTYVPDFVLKDLNLAVELKICNREKREKEIISEINDDILAYNTKYKNLMFIVYDIGHIRDVEQLKSSFKAYDNVIIVVVKH
jgi:hypothetical protein